MLLSLQPKIVDKYYEGSPLNQEAVRTTNSYLQTHLFDIRRELFRIFYAILVNRNSRENAMNYFSEALKRNEKKAQLQSDEKALSSDGFMLNLLSVLQSLSDKIKLDKIDLYYPFREASRVAIKPDETRLKMACPDVSKWQQELTSLANDASNNEPKFNTECFFLCLDCHHLSIISCIRKYYRRKRTIAEYNRIADELSAIEATWENNPIDARRNRLAIKRWREQARKLAKAKVCADAAILDQQLLAHCLSFYSMVMKLLLKSVGYDIETNTIVLPLPPEVPKVFAAYPEWYLDDIADLLLFSVNYVPNVIETVGEELALFIIVFICTSTYIANPYLIAKLIEVLFVSSPVLHPFTRTFHSTILSHPLSRENLAPALMKFYTDVESTGATSEFYDKFSIRYHISVIFKSFWDDEHYMRSVRQESKSGKQFVRFINMLINDTTFLLDESLESLKRIHEIQEEMESQDVWNSKPAEHRQNRQRQLANDERQCRSYLTLASETLDMFHHLTKYIKEPFYKPVSHSTFILPETVNLSYLFG